MMNGPFEDSSLDFGPTRILRQDGRLTPTYRDTN